MLKNNLSGVIMGITATVTLFTSNSLLALPEQPTIDRDVHMSNQANRTQDNAALGNEYLTGSRPEYTRPTLPTLQTSYDGRIALSHKTENSPNGVQVSFRLQKPEKYGGNSPLFHESNNNGTFILDHPNAAAPAEARLGGQTNRVPNTNVLNGSIGGSTNSHMGLCDPTFDEDNNRRNPQACGNDDCYELWVMRFEVLAGGGNRRILHGTQVRVRVDQPKTVNANIASVEVIGRTKTTRPHVMSASFEPMFPGDGRLLVARANNPTLIPAYEGEPAMQSDAMYIVHDNPDQFPACDVRNWEGPANNGTQNFMRPLSFAPYDETINSRYGFAMQPFRDGQNNVIPKNVPLGTYPWIDRGADVISITTIGEELYDGASGNAAGTINPKYASSVMNLQPTCVVGNNICDPTVQTSGRPEDQGAQNGGTLTGRVLMGLWTRGKMVLMDSIINNIDFTLHGNDAAHRNVRLYETGPTRKRIGNGPDNIEQRLPLGNGGNNRFLDSNEHRFNFIDQLRPVTPADVVWTMSSGRGTAEFAFDDYLNPNSFIISNMAQTIRINPANGARQIVENTVGNGAPGGRYNIANNDNVSLANGFNVPPVGRLLGNTRVEPIANGGIHGKGLWLDGSGEGIAYDIPNQPHESFENSSWYYGLFVDERGSTNGERDLISFPDGSSIRLFTNNGVRFYNGNNQVNSFTNNGLNNAFNHDAWKHYGFNISNNGSETTVVVYFNGIRVHSFNTNGVIFQLESGGDLTVGTGTGASDLEGWIDEFKVFAETLSPELACNAASGTLAGVANAGQAPNLWDTTWANNVGAATHTEITAALNISNGINGNRTIPTYPEYVCYHDYSDDLAGHLDNIPNGLAGIRDNLLFPEGPLLRNQPRPNSRNNQFCLSCHSNDNPAGSGLRFNALTSRNDLAPVDTRRQPMQPEARVYGNVPNGWLGFTGAQINAARESTNGPVLIDRLLLPTGAGGGGGTPTPTPTPTPAPTPTPNPGGGGTVNLVDAANNITYSNNWTSNANRVRAHDGNPNNVATTTSRGTANGGGIVFIDFNFGSQFTNFTVTMQEDNANPHQVSRWRVRRWQNGSWRNIGSWQNSGNATLKTFPIGNNIASDRLRIQFQAPVNQQVGVQEVTITGVAN